MFFEDWRVLRRPLLKNFSFQFLKLRPRSLPLPIAASTYPPSLPPYKRLRCGTDNVRERRPGNIKRASHLLRDKPGLLWHDLELIVLVCVSYFAPERKLKKKKKTVTASDRDLCRCARSPNELSPIRLSSTNPPSSLLPLGTYVLRTSVKCGSMCSRRPNQGWWIGGRAKCKRPRQGKDQRVDPNVERPGMNVNASVLGSRWPAFWVSRCD